MTAACLHSLRGRDDVDVLQNLRSCVLHVVPRIRRNVGNHSRRNRKARSPLDLCLTPSVQKDEFLFPLPRRGPAHGFSRFQSHESAAPTGGFGRLATEDNHKPHT